VTPQPESAILHAVRDHLRLQGWFVIRHQAGLGTHPGLSDLTATREGITIFVEVKTASGRLSEAQERFRRDVEAHSATYLVCRSVDDIAAVVGGCLVLDTVP
jgi:Holliday junction resolvase-like predicted endonuclease